MPDLINEAPISLKQCGICDQKFSRSLTLSQHLNIHGIEWKVYWDMYLHHVSGLTCNLCNAAHADVYSLESHLKLTHCIKAAIETSVNSHVKQDCRICTTPASGSTGVTKAAISNDVNTNRSPATTHDGQKSRNVKVVKDVRVLSGDSVGRGRGLAHNRAGSSQTIIIATDERVKMPKSAPVRTEHAPSMTTAAALFRTAGVATLPPHSFPGPSAPRDAGPGNVVPLMTRGGMTNTTPNSVPEGVQKTAKRIRTAGVATLPPHSFPGPSAPRDAGPGNVVPLMTRGGMTNTTPKSVPEGVQNTAKRIQTTGVATMSPNSFPGPSAPRDAGPGNVVPSMMTQGRMTNTTSNYLLKGVQNIADLVQTAGVATMSPNSFPGPLVPRDVGLRTAVPSMTSRGRVTSITSSTRASQSSRLAPRELGSTYREGDTVGPDEVTEVGRVVSVPLEGPVRGHRKRLASQMTDIDIIEVVDVDRQPTYSSDCPPIVSSKTLSDESAPTPSYHSVMAARNTTQKPTAVVPPYESEREQLQQSAGPSESRGPSSSRGGTKIFALPYDYYQTSPTISRPPTRSAGSSGRSNDRSQPTRTRVLPSPSSGLPQASVAAPPTAPQRSAQQPAAAPPLATQQIEPAALPAAPSVAAPATCGAPPATCGVPPATCGVPPATCGVPPATCGVPPVVSKPTLLPWLDPVYQPGTLTRLSEQAAALSWRPDSPSQTGQLPSGGQLRRLVDRSQRLMVDNQVVMARDHSGNTVPVLRLLAAAESDQLAAGHSGGHPPGTHPETAADDRAQSGSGAGQSVSTVQQEGTPGCAGQPLALLPQSLSGAGPQDADLRGDGGSTGAAQSVKNRLGDPMTGGKSDDVLRTERCSDKDSLRAGALTANFKTEPFSPTKAGGVSEMEDEVSFLTSDDSVKEELGTFHPSVGIDVGPAGEPQPPHDGADADDIDLGVKLEQMMAEVKAEATVVGLGDDDVSLDDGEGVPLAEPFVDVPAATADGDPLAVAGDLKLTAVGSEFGGLLPGVAIGRVDELLDSLPAPPTPPAPTAPRRRVGRPKRVPPAGDVTGGVEVDTAVVTRGRRGAPAGDNGSASARQNAAAHRRRKKKHIWGEQKKKNGTRPLFRKPEGTGDGEIDPGNTVEILFLNDDDGQESYDAMDAMVLKVNTEVRPTRYYVHFKDTSFRHDRWVTRPDISRVYRSALRPLKGVEEPPTPAASATATAAGRGGGDGDPAAPEQQAPAAGSATEPAEKTLRLRRPLAESGPSSEFPASGPSGERPGPARGRGSARRGRRGRPPGRAPDRPDQTAALTVRRTFVPLINEWINSKPTAPMESGRLVQVVYEETADGAQLICPAKIVRVNAELNYRRYLVRYLGWQRRYREWVTDSVVRCPPTPEGHNAGGQILRRCVLSPPSCPESTRAAYANLRPCSVDMAAGNMFFLAASRSQPRVINDTRIAALMSSLRPRRDDPFGSRTTR